MRCISEGVLTSVFIFFEWWYWVILASVLKISEFPKFILIELGSSALKFCPMRLESLWWWVHRHWFWVLVSAGMSWLMPEYDRTLREQPCQHHQDGVPYHRVQFFREFCGSSSQRVIPSMVFFDIVWWCGKRYTQSQCNSFQWYPVILKSLQDWREVAEHLWCSNITVLKGQYMEFSRLCFLRGFCVTQNVISVLPCAGGKANGLPPHFLLAPHISGYAEA